MIKKTSFLLLTLLVITACKNQKEEHKSLIKKQDKDNDSIYLLEKEENTKAFSLENLKGKWELKKSSKSGDSKTYNFELLDSEFILNDGICDASFEIDTIHNLEYHVEGHFYNHSLKEEMKTLEDKLYNLFEININTFQGVITMKCSPPFHKIYVFGDDLVVWYSGNYLHFTKKSEKPKELLFKCKENDNGKSRYDDALNKTCVCNENTFNSAYKIFYKESPDYLKTSLLEELPQQNREWKAKDADVSYRWILEDTLKIDMYFQGGENYYVFYKNNDNKIEYKEYLSLP
jgi:hypothetical protein